MGHAKKHIVISGAGEVGRYIAEVLLTDGHNITIIDNNMATLKDFSNKVEVRAVYGSSCHANVLANAQVEECDVLIAATSFDEINLLTGAIGRKLGANKVIARVRQKTFYSNKMMDYQDILSLDALICPDELTARAILSKLCGPGVIALQRFASNTIEVRQFLVKHNSSAAGSQLRDLKLPPGVRITTIRRADGLVEMANADAVINNQDLVTLIGPAKTLPQVKSIFQKHKTPHRDIVLVGATPIAEWLLAEIDHRIFSVRLFEKDISKAEDFATRFPKITVLNSDPVDPHTFEEEHIGECFAYIAVDNNEEHNILGSVQAKKLGVGQTFAVVQNSNYLNSLAGIGIDRPISPKIEGAKELIRMIDDAAVKQTAAIEGVAFVYETTARHQGDAVGQALQDISVPKGAFVAAVQRGGRVFAPKKEDSIEAGDKLIIIGPKAIEKPLKKLFVR